MMQPCPMEKRIAQLEQELQAMRDALGQVELLCSEIEDATSISNIIQNTVSDPRPIWVRECPVTKFGIKIGDYYYNYEKCESFIGMTVIVSLWPDRMYIQVEDGTMITSNQAPNPRLFNQP